MATVRVNTFLIEEWLFKGLDVEIRDARMATLGGDYVEFSLRGKDVPDCEQAIVICHSYREPGDDPHVKVEIKAADTPPRVDVRINKDKNDQHKVVGAFIADYGNPEAKPEEIL